MDEAREGRQVASATWDEAHRPGRRTVDEPRTAAGRALLDELPGTVVAGGSVREYVVAIEREAARAEVAEPEVECPYCGLGRAHDPRCRMAEVAEPGDGPGSDQWDVPWRVSDTGRDPVDGRWLVHTAGASVIADVVSERHARWIAATWNASLGRAATAGREPLDALREAADDVIDSWHHQRYTEDMQGPMERLISVRAALDTPDPGAS